MVEFDRRWGGLALPPALGYDGGPRWFAADEPTRSPDGRWRFDAGDPRSAVPYSFEIGPDGEFGLGTLGWVPLHTRVEGWIESLALEYHASSLAKRVAVAAEIDLTGFEPIPEVHGMANNWWRGDDQLVAVHSTISGASFVRIYDGVPDVGLLSPRAIRS
ncbi:hypothetical protein AB0E59_18100 [Lentzea sp. NPDC034063]|uniref:hypothetical protein n=1 Tax=unclassified Lentzea TaxID=2643253 RepID=UPI00340AD8FB